MKKNSSRGRVSLPNSRNIFVSLKEGLLWKAF